MPLNSKERKMAATTILNLDCDEIVNDFVIIAHVHTEEDECQGKIIIGANCDRNVAISMLATSIPKY